jgi:hypothetical protein
VDRCHIRAAGKLACTVGDPPPHFPLNCLAGDV